MPELTLDQALQLALQTLKEGRHAEAEQILRQILAAVPAHPGTRNSLGESLLAQGRIGEALPEFEQAVRLMPDYARAWANLAGVLGQMGRLDEALAAYRQAISQRPDFAEGLCSVGNILAMQGKHPEAILEFREALRLKPNFAEACLSLGTSLATLGDKQNAETFFRTAIRINPQMFQAWANLGVLLQAHGALEESQHALAQALALKPDNAGMYFQMGGVLSAQGHHAQAAEAYAQAARLDPSHADAFNNLGIALRMVGKVDASAGAFRRAVTARPAFVQAWSNLAVVLDLKGERDEALVCHRRAVDLAPNDAASHDNLLYALHFHPQANAMELLQEHREWNRRHAAPLATEIPRHPNAPDPNRRLRIGYVSPDFRDHPVGRFMLPLIAAHDRKAVEVICYADVLASDDVAKKIHRHCHGWRDITGMPDAMVSHQVRLDQIDILVDLTMHMTGNRLLVFARKPAPVQVTYLAYCSTTGLEAIDYRISDPHLDPEETESYVEKTMRIESYWCYAASPEAPLPNALPALASGEVTFGCLNGFGKVSDAALATWARVLLAVPRSRLLLHANPGGHRDRTQGLLERLGVSPGRCEFVGLSNLAEYFRLYHRIDIALDPFPYAGGTTTCDALWMGVPVVTLRGLMAIGRGGVSILKTLGISEWIAQHETEYVEIAARVAADLPALARWRSTLRQRMVQSPLMDAGRCARELESAYRKMWKNWCSAPH